MQFTKGEKHVIKKKTKQKPEADTFLVCFANLSKSTTTKREEKKKNNSLKNS